MKNILDKEEDGDLAPRKEFLRQNSPAQSIESPTAYFLIHLSLVRCRFVDISLLMAS